MVAKYYGRKYPEAIFCCWLAIAEIYLYKSVRLPTFLSCPSGKSVDIGALISLMILFLNEPILNLPLRRELGKANGYNIRYELW